MKDFNVKNLKIKLEFIPEITILKTYSDISSQMHSNTPAKHWMLETWGEGKAKHWKYSSGEAASVVRKILEMTIRIHDLFT